VLAALSSTGIETHVYSDGPGELAWHGQDLVAKTGDALLAVNFFGLRNASPFSEIELNGMAVIEDHTHDPWSDWSWKSKADWCVASLRKTCPLPDGGVLWSPAGHSLPRSPDVTDTRREASLEKLVSMLMKRMFLEGARVDKETFRSFSVSAEQRIASGSVSGMSDWARMMLRSFPFMRWRALRAANYAILSSLVTTPTLTRLEPQSGACPFSFVFLFRCHAERELVRAHLLSHRIYPSILWNLERPLSSSIPKAAVAFSERMLSLHCDYRYGAEDMEVVADVLKRVKYLRIGSVDWQ
jgi:hypothetical protein